MAFNPLGNAINSITSIIPSFANPTDLRNEGSTVFYNDKGKEAIGNFLEKVYNDTQAQRIKQELSDLSVNNAFSLDVDMTEGLLGLGQQIANASIANQNSVNGLNKYMWEQGEANTDRRFQQEMDFNAAQSQLARDFSAQQAQNAMDFEERMSNTAHQREVEDLKAAGLNPVLSANNGASTPSGLMGGASTASTSGKSANGFSAQQANIVGAYSAAGQFISNMYALKETMRNNDRRFGSDLVNSLLRSFTYFL